MDQKAEFRNFKTGVSSKSLQNQLRFDIAGTSGRKLQENSLVIGQIHFIDQGTDLNLFFFFLGGFYHLDGILGKKTVYLFLPVFRCTAFPEFYHVIRCGNQSHGFAGFLIRHLAEA